MNIIQFKGHHSRIPHADPTLLPDRNHTLWQAWLLPSGRYIVQALGSGNRPEGIIHLMDAANFSQALTPLLASVSPASQATAPNLIGEWYNEIASLKGQEFYGPLAVEYGNWPLPPLHPETLAAIEQVKLLAEEDNALAKGVEPLVQQVKEQPHSLRQQPPSASPAMPASFPDSSGYPMAPEETGQAPVPQRQPGQATAQPTPHGGNPMQEGLQPTSQADTPSPHSGPAPFGGSSSRQLENILQSIHDNDEKGLEERVHHLIGIPMEESDASYQAVLTELGLALRQRKRYKLAKLCHLKALELAPDDERILFNLARTEYEDGNIMAARNHLKHCLALAPDFDVAKNFLAFIGGGS